MRLLVQSTSYRNLQRGDVVCVVPDDHVFLPHETVGRVEIAVSDDMLIWGRYVDPLYDTTTGTTDRDFRGNSAPSNASVEQKRRLSIDLDLPGRVETRTVDKIVRRPTRGRP